MGLIARRVADFPEDPLQRSDREALYELLKTHDLYATETTTCVDFQWDRLKMLQGGIEAADIKGRLTG